MSEARIRVTLMIDLEGLHYMQPDQEAVIDLAYRVLRHGLAQYHPHCTIESLTCEAFTPTPFQQIVIDVDLAAQHADEAIHRLMKGQPL